MKIGELVKQYRTTHHLSQREFATRCGLSNGMISLIEKGINPQTNEPIIPSLPSLNSIANGMGMNIDDLLERADDMDVSLSRTLYIGQKINMTIGDRIRNLRECRRMSQDELAKAVGYESRSSIGKIELGKVEVTQPTIIAIAKALGTTPGYLMGWENETAPSAESLEDLVLAKKISRMSSDSKKLVIDLINKLSGE